MDLFTSDVPLSTSTALHRSRIADLYLLSQLKPGKTLSTRDHQVVDHTTMTSWYRWWHDEDRGKSVDLIYIILDASSRYVETLLESIQTSLEARRSLSMALVVASHGVSSLTETYAGDSTIVTRVQVAASEFQLLARRCQAMSTIGWSDRPSILGQTRITPTPILHRDTLPVDAPPIPTLHRIPGIVETYVTDDLN